MDTLDWRRAGGDRRGRPIYRADDADGHPYTIVRGEWRQIGQHVNRHGARYGRRYTMRGYAIHYRGRYLTRRRTLALAKGVAEAHSRGIPLRMIDR